MISVCIIVKNDASNLSECLKRLDKYDFEIIVVDTGSTDSTKVIAQEHTERVFDFVWCDDFSKARNFAIAKASNDFILMVDSDEFITEIDVKRLEKLINENPQKVGRLKRENEYYGEAGFNIKTERVNRLFNKKYFHYEGRIHEQVTSLDGSEYDTYDAPVYMDHVGYKGNSEEIAEKSERNIRLLEVSLEQDGEDPYTYYQLGRSYFAIKDYEKAVKYFERAMDFDVDPRLEYVADLVESYGYALVNSNQAAKALQLEGVYEEFKRSADFVFLMGVIYMQNSLFNEAVIEFEKAAKYASCKVRGVNSYSAYYNCGVIYECLGDKKAAINYYKKCGDYEPAKKGIKRVS